MKKSPELDEVDRLGGNMLHQGGPYEALSPRRNRNRDRANSDAPVAAFDPNGPNSNPAITNPQEEREFNMRPHLEVALELTDDAPVKGPDSAGLGPTTYMDNAPASRQAIAEQDKNIADPDPLQGDGLLGRVRSLRRDHSQHGTREESEGLLGRVRSIGRGNRSRSNTASSKREYDESTIQGDFGEPVGHSTTNVSYAETLHHRTKGTPKEDF